MAATVEVALQLFCKQWLYIFFGVFFFFSKKDEAFPHTSDWFYFQSYSLFLSVFLSGCQYSEAKCASHVTRFPCEMESESVKYFARVC